jgi:hypothetical protein
MAPPAAAKRWRLRTIQTILPMGVRTRGLDIAINAKRQVADAAARAEAKTVIERWNEQLSASRNMLWSPTHLALDQAVAKREKIMRRERTDSGAGWLFVATFGHPPIATPQSDDRCPISGFATGIPAIA